MNRRQKAKQLEEILQQLEGNPNVRRREDRTGYDTPQGFMPSVTTVLSATAPEESKKRLEAWLKRPGSAEESKRACNRGSWVHEQLENHLSGEPVKKHLIYGPYLDSMMPWVEENIIEPIAMEKPIYHPAGFSGTFDLLALMDDNNFFNLVDWKTSKRKRSADLVEQYAQQLVAYRMGLDHTYEVKPERGVLVIGRPSGTTPDVWFYSEYEMDRREDIFLERVERFHMENQP